MSGGPWYGTALETVIWWRGDSGGAETPVARGSEVMKDGDDSV